MNEKTKQILRYVACGLGGLALGIGLLGGLAMCASSGKSTKAESVNTILTKKNAVSTNSTTGITTYQFSLSNNYSAVAEGEIYTAIYAVDRNFDLTLYADGAHLEAVNDYYDLVSILETRYEEAKSTTDNDLRFMHSTFKYRPSANASLQYGEYFSFVLPSASYSTIISLPFVLTNATNPIFKRLDEYRSNSNGNFFNLTLERSQLYIHYASIPTYQPNFQDVPSYYQSQGWEDGYDDGYSSGYDAGNSAGYSSGYSDGYETGEDVGYSSGYADGFRTGYMNTYYAFTSLTANLNKVWNMAEIPWHRNTDILVTQDNFNDFPFFDIAHLQVGIYINWAYLALFRDTVTLTPYYVYAQRYTTSQNHGYNVSINIAPASQDTIQEDGNIGGTTGPYLLQEDSLFQLSHTTVWTAPNRCRLIGFMEDTQDIYTNWFDNGYLIPQGIEVDTNAYEEGYRQGQHDATNETDIQNVFSLLTPAFTAVGGFFNLKVFGFLPLYWFFLAPLFVALITLILRMVKH